MVMKHVNTQGQTRVPITILSIEGSVDGSTFEKLVDQAQFLYQAGTKELILDITHVDHVSSAGLVALYQIARMMRGDPPQDLDGWSALHAIANDTGHPDQHVKLLNPQPQVDRVLERAGMKSQFEIYADLPSAVGSF